jgi:hypothetical protein
MKDPFFEGIDWEALERKELDPPIVLNKEGTVEVDS